MMGVIFLVVLVVYFALSAWVVRGAVRWAKDNNRTPWRWGMLAGLVMYLIVFWDHIPTWVAHKYYCDKYAGLTVHKTVEQWKVENPGVAEGLHANKHAKRYELSSEIVRLDINDRMAWDKSERIMFLGIKRIENMVIDKLFGTVLAQQIDFNTDIMNISLGARGFRDYKLWLGRDSCQQDVKDRQEFYKFEASIEKMGDEK
jgi:hypothetical protein